MITDNDDVKIHVGDNDYDDDDDKYDDGDDDDDDDKYDDGDDDHDVKIVSYMLHHHICIYCTYSCGIVY